MDEINENEEQLAIQREENEEMLREKREEQEQFAREIREAEEADRQARQEERNFWIEDAEAWRDEMEKIYNNSLEELEFYEFKAGMKKQLLADA